MGGKITDTDSWQDATGKISRGITGQITSTRGKTEDNQAAQLDELKEEVNRLKQSQGKKTEAIRSTCNTCTRPTHGKGACPGKKVECYGCGQMGHFEGSKMCRRKTEEKKKKKKSTCVDTTA